MAQSVEHVALDLTVVSWSPMFNVEIILKRKENKNCLRMLLKRSGLHAFLSGSFCLSKLIFTFSVPGAIHAGI